MRNTRQRRQQIRELLLRDGSVYIADLIGRFRVAPATIRVDLNHIESQGLAVRHRGGATLVRRATHERDAPGLSLKETIGARAARMVKPGENILIDSDPTAALLARHLRGHTDITVMTNGINVALELSHAPGVELLLTSGYLHKHSLSLNGGQAAASLGNYSFDTLFLGVDGLDLQFGLSTQHEAKADLNSRMVERARRIVVLADASKFGRVSLHRIARLDQVHSVITDGGIAADHLESLRGSGIEVIVAND